MIRLVLISIFIITQHLLFQLIMIVIRYLIIFAYLQQPEKSIALFSPHYFYFYYLLEHIYAQYFTPPPLKPTYQYK